MRGKEKDSQSFCAKLAVMISVLMLILVMIATGSKTVYAADNARATTNNDSGDTVTSPKKIISVVYDDSGSMAGERWTYANYSLQTLTSLLNTQDELYVTYMSDPSDAKKISLTDIQDSVDKIRDKEDSHNTPEESIDTAVGKLDSVKGTDATTQYWLIIMTDGAINGMSNEELQKKIDSVKNKKMDNGSSMYIDYLGMGDAWNIKADEANGLYSFKATDDKILDVMKALANQISGRIEVDSSNITQVDKKTVKVHSELPLYSLSVLSQESDAKVLSAKAENELDVERNISLNATDLKNGIKKEKMFGNAAVISNGSKAIYQGDYTINFSKKVDVKNLTFLYEPAIEFIVNITKQGIKVDDPKTLKVGDKIDIEIVPVVPGTDTQISDSVLPKNTAFGVQYAVNESVVKKSSSRSLTDVKIKAGKNVINTQMQIPGFVPITKQVAMFHPIEKVDYSFKINQSDGASYNRSKLELISGKEIQFWILGNGKKLSKKDTKDIKIDVAVAGVDKSGIKEKGFRGFINRFGLKNAKVKIQQKEDGSYILKLKHPIAIAPFATHAGKYTVKVTFDNNKKTSSKVTFTVVPEIGEWFWMIVCIFVIIFILYILDILFLKSKFHGETVYYTQYRLLSDGSGKLQAGQGDAKRLPFLTPNLFIPFVTRSASVTFQGMKLVADESIVKIPGKAIKQSVYAYGKSSDKPEKHLGRIVKSMKVVDSTKSKKETIIPDVILNQNKTYFKSGENDRTVWAMHIE
ncbi:MAG: hypothetical protein SO471_05755 [Anaerobutyricum hallii]|uniref:hypothetical protein n=1 Tax=Anaerobutyricum hallii TaxID=39488 RepID=UPI002A82F731|nr:hypothetical protein [Anaerobutyricum hallii]MDY4577479.1 hypothetical protein [Anaerobutyricum hallii]